MRIILMILRALRWGSTFVGLGTISLASARFLRRRQQNRLIPRNHDSTFVIRGQDFVARTKLIKTNTRPVRGSCFSVLICVYPCPSVVSFLLGAGRSPCRRGRSAPPGSDVRRPAGRGGVPDRARSGRPACLVRATPFPSLRTSARRC